MYSKGKYGQAQRGRGAGRGKGCGAGSYVEPWLFSRLHQARRENRGDCSDDAKLASVIWFIGWEAA